MCGLCGVFSYRTPAQPVNAAEINRMRDFMHHRGPDGLGTWVTRDGTVGLGHRRLSIIDLSEDGAQPMLDADERFAIVFNGEIYNYRALKAELAALGHKFKTHSDTEVIIELYKRYGVESFRRLRGMYAIAIWDNATRSMTLVRDPFGVKPLYIADNGKVIRFASQVKALVAGGRAGHRIDTAGHVGFFLYGHIPEPFTLYRDISAFPAGHYRVIRDDDPGRNVEFLSVTTVLARAVRESPAMQRSSQCAELREYLIDSLRSHFVSDVPVGIFLSAGRDSTTLAALSSENGEKIQTFTLGFKEFIGSERDETTIAESVAAILGVPHITRWVSSTSFHDQLSCAIDAMDQPSTDGMNTYFVSKLASEAGMKVALSGLGGDELFGSYPSFGQIPSMYAVARHVPGAVRFGRVAREMSEGWISRFGSPKYAGLLEYSSTVSGAFLLRRALYMPWELTKFLDAELVKDGLSRLAPVATAEDLIRGIGNPYASVMALEMTLYMRDRLLRDSDWASMAHSLELRVPFVDWTLFERLAPFLVGKSRLHKGDLATCPRKPLPPTVTRRPKTGFQIPVQKWLAEGAPGPNTLGHSLRHWSHTVYKKFTGVHSVSPMPSL